VDLWQRIERLRELACMSTSADKGHGASVAAGSAADFDDLPRVLTSAEAARALRIGVKELRQLIDAGHLPAARLGPRRVIRIAKSAILGVLNGTIPRTS